MVPGASRHIVLFGLSADPPTGAGGHGGLVAALAAQPGVDGVWALPVFRHSFAEKRRQAPFDHRLEMCRLGLPPFAPGLEVLAVEQEVALAAGEGAQLGTVDVLAALQVAHPDTTFSIALGADAFADLRAGRWKGGDALGRRAHLYVAPRVGCSPPNLEGCPSASLLPPLQAVASSTVRASLAAGSGDQGALHPAVLDYIHLHRLYQSET